MSIHFYPQLPLSMNVGETVTGLDKVEWICLVPCTVLGFTLGGYLPVLGNVLMPHLNTVELAIKSENPGVKPGQSLVEAKALGKYHQLGPNDVEEIEGKKILKWEYDSFDSFIMLFDDNTYLKMEIDNSDYDGPSLSMEEITLGDLLSMDLLPPETLKEHQEEKSRFREAQDQVQGAHSLACAIDSLGIDRVKEMIAKTTPEN